MTLDVDAERDAPATADPTPAGRLRRLRRLGDRDGIVAGIAIDHRDSLRAVLERAGIGPMSTAGLQAQKLALAEALATGATAVMLDAELGDPALAAGVVPAEVGLIMPLEEQGYEEQGDRPRTSLLVDFTPVDALRRGADACKLLLPYRPDDEETAAFQDGVVRDAVELCHAVGLPIVVEPVVRRLSTETAEAFAASYADLVVTAVRRVQPLGVDLLKLPFPWLDATSATSATSGPARSATERMAAACDGTPWVLLGAGADAESFVEQIRVAGTTGACGFLAGRGIWGPALREDPAETGRLAATIARPILERCAEAARATAHPIA